MEKSLELYLDWYRISFLSCLHYFYVSLFNDGTSGTQQVPTSLFGHCKSRLSNKYKELDGDHFGAGCGDGVRSFVEGHRKPLLSNPNADTL
mmetsp:Transcript_6017/g.8765  ORF Transcript_6017/g.8765 Transcript_6017/m.8765 type:complete len:91 (+) Transcript_6017:1941-2213(+)